MANQFTSITNINTLDSLMARSHEEPVLLFKHSTTCPISTHAHREMAQLEVPVNMVIVQSGRDISQEIARRTGVRHESPQTLVVRNGEVVWTASHYDITADDVTRQMQKQMQAVGIKD